MQHVMGISTKPTGLFDNIDKIDKHLVRLIKKTEASPKKMIFEMRKGTQSDM